MVAICLNAREASCRNRMPQPTSYKNESFGMHPTALSNTLLNLPEGAVGFTANLRNISFEQPPFDAKNARVQHWVALMFPDSFREIKKSANISEASSGDRDP
jgi:hypothetical protein